MATATLLQFKRFDRLSYWFIAHGIIDLLFAIPMLVVPEAFLKALGWQLVDPVVARVVAAALIGHGKTAGKYGRTPSRPERNRMLPEAVHP